MRLEIEAMKNKRKEEKRKVNKGFTMKFQESIL